MKTSSGKTNSQAGISIVESLITLFIIGLMLVMYQLAVSKMRLIRYAKDEEIALQIANNKIEELRSQGYDNLPPSGNFSSTQMNELSSATGSMAISDLNATTKEVLVSVEWHENGTPARTISLSTLITKTGGL